MEKGSFREENSQEYADHRLHVDRSLVDSSKNSNPCYCRLPFLCFGLTIFSVAASNSDFKTLVYRPNAGEFEDRVDIRQAEVQKFKADFERFVARASLEDIREFRKAVAALLALRKAGKN